MRRVSGIEANMNPAARENESVPQVSPAPAPEETLAWTSWPARERPRRAALLALLIAGIAALVGWSFHDALWGALAALMLGFSVARFFAPTRYRFDAEGIEVSFMGLPRRRGWVEFRRFEAGPAGVFLSPFPARHRLDNFRGLYVMYGRHREEVLAFVRRRFSAE